MERIDKIIHIKKLLENENAKIIKEIDSRIAKLKRRREDINKEISEINKLIVESQDPVPFIFKEKALVSELKDIEKKINELEKEKEKKVKELMELHREVESLKIIENNQKYEKISADLKKELINNGYLDLIKKFLLSVLLIISISFSEKVVEEKVKAESDKEIINKLKLIEKAIELKLKEIRAEREKIEKLKKEMVAKKEKPVPEEVEKLIKILNKTSTDEAGQIMNNLDPYTAAEVLIKLKERQAAEIMAAMDPKHAAKVSKIIMSRKKENKFKRQ